MRTTLTEEQVRDEILGARNYAWRWEQQPTYWVGRERDRVQAFLDGRREPPTANPHGTRWLNTVHAMVAAGRRLGRVRVIDTPPSGYQQWLQWNSQWARAAGEDIHYLSRPLLRQLGRPPIEPDADWWLIDGERLVVMRFDDSGRLTETELFVDEPQVRLARLWRLAVISWAVEEETDRQETAAA